MAETDDLSLASTVLTEVKDCALDLAGALVNNMTDCWNVTSQMNSTSPKPTLAASSCEYGPGYLRWLSDVVLLPPIVVFGVIGNVMAFATLCAQRGNLSTSILLRFIAVIDTLLLLSAVPMRFMRQIDVCHNTFPYGFLATALFAVSSSSSNYFSGLSSLFSMSLS